MKKAKLFIEGEEVDGELYDQWEIYRRYTKDSFSLLFFTLLTGRFKDKNIIIKENGDKFVRWID